LLTRSLHISSYWWISTRYLPKGEFSDASKGRHCHIPPKACRQTPKGESNDGFGKYDSAPDNDDVMSESPQVSQIPKRCNAAYVWGDILPEPQQSTRSPATPNHTKKRRPGFPGNKPFPGKPYFTLIDDPFPSSLPPSSDDLDYPALHFGAEDKAYSTDLALNTNLPSRHAERIANTRRMSGWINGDGSSNDDEANKEMDTEGEMVAEDDAEGEVDAKDDPEDDESQ
jgi:hypothetical protein